MSVPTRPVKPGLQLVVERVFPASRERVFRAWTDPTWMQRWFAPLGMQPVGVEAELSVGGRYRIGMRQPDGSVHVAAGRYLEIQPPERLVFTWGWLEEEPEVGAARLVGPGDDSVVTVEFFEQGEATRVVVRHVRLPDAHNLESHTKGWNACLDHLAQSIAAGNI